MSNLSVKKENIPLVEYRILVFEHKERNARITAVVLGMIALFLFATASLLFGMGSLSPTFLMGLGLFPYLAGAIISFIALGVLSGMFIFAAISAVRNCQKERSQSLCS